MAGFTLLTTCVVVADVVVIDGDRFTTADEWTDYDSSHNDPNGDVADNQVEPPQPMPAYDLDWTYAKWDATNLTTNFMGATIDPLSHVDADDRVEILLNIDDDAGTGSAATHGVEGLEYRAAWNLDGTENTAYSNATWQEWTGDQSTGFWQNVSGWDSSTITAAWGNTTDEGVIEISMDPTIFETPSKFTWGMYLDNGTNASDDFSPADYNQRGYTPEPGTMALVSLGIAGLIGWRRRREK